MGAKLPSVETVFSEALEIASAAERAAYLDRACGGDAALRRQVEALLGAHDRAGGFLEAPDAAPTVAHDPSPPAEGARHGHRPLQAAGADRRGGHGRRLHGRADAPGPPQGGPEGHQAGHGHAAGDRPVRGRAPGPGADGPPQHRQGPRRRRHRVRAGPTSSWSWSAASRSPTTATARRLPIPERLELFVLVCRAVQHAHQKGIIHRDLKPSNVLVTVLDGVPVPKVIDFGVAKATGQSLTEQTLFTGFPQLVGTPLYMSPEQADLSGVDVDTRSDIYSLGVLLYELLTGTTPFDRETLRKAAFDEMRRIIREEEPPKPSTRLSALGETLSTVSANAGLRPAAAGPGRAGRARLDRDEGAGEGPAAAVRDGQRLRGRRDAVPDRPAGRGVPAVGVVPVRRSSPAGTGRASTTAALVAMPWWRARR